MDLHQFQAPRGVRSIYGEEKRRKEEEAKAAASVHLLDRLIIHSVSGMSSSSAASGFTRGIEQRNIPQIPILNHSKMGKSRIWLKWKSGCVLLMFSVPGWP